MNDLGGFLAGRRDLLKAGMGASLAALWAQVARAAPLADTHDTRLLDVVCDLTIPATKLPGARAAGVPEFLALAIAHQTLGAVGDETSRLRAELDRACGAAFLDQPPARQFAVLEALDASCLPPRPGAPASAWPVVKSLILAGYYSSELGGSKDERYVLVPGRFDADIPYHSGDPALSNDWAGVAFR